MNATVFVLGFLGTTAFLGGLQMLIWPTGNAVIPQELLADLPVDTFVLPGIVLAAVFGIGASTTAYGLWRQPFLPSLRWVERMTGRHWAWAATLVTGWLFTTWMLLELALLGAPWAGGTSEQVTAWTLYTIYLTVSAWLLVAPWTREVRRDLRIIDLTAVESEELRPLVSHRVLVAYGSRRGGTAGLAGMIGEELELHGFDVDVLPARSVRDVHGYGAVVLGGALYATTWHRDARRFALRHRRTLRQRPVWLFSSGPLDASATERDLLPVPQARMAMGLTAARGHVTFGGVLSADAEGWLASGMAEDLAGDWRDRDHVARWVATVADALLPLLPRADHVPGSTRPLPKRTTPLVRRRAPGPTPPLDDVPVRMTMTARASDAEGRET